MKDFGHRCPYCGAPEPDPACPECGVWAPDEGADHEPLQDRITHLENAIHGIREFALTHEVGQPHNILLYALVVTIPQRAETALELPPGGRGGGG